MREALRTPSFWLLSIGHGFTLFVVWDVNTHAITHMKEGLGYTIETASFVIMLQTVAQLGGTVLAFWIGDRIDKRILSALCMLGHMSGLLFLTYATGPAMIVAYTILHGTAWGLRGPFMYAIRADYFGRSAIGMILGLSSVIVVIGQIGGPMIAGILADMTGDYRAGQRQRVQAGADPVVAGWQCFLEGMLIRLEDYLIPGSLVTFQSVAPDENVFFEGLNSAVAIPPNVSAVFIPPSVLQGMMFTPDSGPAPARIPNDSGILLACRQRDYTIVLNTFFAFPPYAAGIDVYEEGRVLAGYSYATVNECRENLARVMNTYLNPRTPISS